jgi:hypothetical protein
VRDSIGIVGIAADQRFKEYRVEMRPAGSASWEQPEASLIGRSSSPVTGGTLAGLNTRELPDGDYELRLSVSDTLGLTGSTLVSFVIDNQAPYAPQTSPARVNAAAGGDVYTTNGEAHLYFPPHAFRQDVEVTIDPLAAPDVPDTLPEGAVRIRAGFEISWGSDELTKPAVAELSYAGASRAGRLALYTQSSGSAWRRVGGAADAASQRIAAPVTQPGRYALFSESAAATGGPGTLSPISLTPRVFSPRGSYANTQVAIGFTMARPGAVTVKIFNRAGRSVREVLSGETLGAGANLVRWDGRDSDGAIVGDDVYLVSVEALGARETRALAVVR